MLKVAEKYDFEPIYRPHPVTVAPVPDPIIARYQAGKKVQLPPSAKYGAIVREGAVGTKLLYTNGKSSLIDVAAVGEVVGNIDHALPGEALRESTTWERVALWESELEMITEDHQLSGTDQFLEATRVLRYQIHLIECGEEKIVDRFREMLDLFGQKMLKEYSDGAYELPGNTTDLSELIGTAREHLDRVVIKPFRNLGVLKRVADKKTGNWLITDMHAFMDQ